MIEFAVEHTIYLQEELLTPTDTIPAAAGGTIAGATQYSTFYVDGSFFGVDVLDVQEVLRYQEMTRVPLAASTVEGLINLRGQIVTAIDMRRRLGLHARPEGMDLMKRPRTFMSAKTNFRPRFPKVAYAAVLSVAEGTCVEFGSPR